MGRYTNITTLKTAGNKNATTVGNKNTSEGNNKNNGGFHCGNTSMKKIEFSASLYTSVTTRLLNEQKQDANVGQKN